MKIALFAFLVFSLAAGITSAKDKPCQPHRHARIPAIKDLTYHKARKRLLAAGWRPLRTIPFNGADEAHGLNGNGPLFWRRGYVEVESCAGTGYAGCAFLFKDAYGNRLRVNTTGEELPKEKAYATVNGFHFMCE
jgi:hypothetical protein